ncbi:MAG TPA: hypothetical protein DCG75_08215 [Bacteroidales bacterium]|jgi:phosphoribosyl 1,2-cyclic phosphodiesterase|nr:hypothetical protein [Bacteroidales bacterium]
MSQIKVRINGRGNAWPILLGQDHPFYDRTNYEDLANASCSIIKSKNKHPTEKDMDWDLMIDAGHGAVQYLLKNCNRIPEAIFLTHPHIDHTLSLDWIVQSYFKLNKKRYPVYATAPCWDKVKITFPHLAEMVDFKEIIPYQKITIIEVEGVDLIPYPVYHGKSADGATMLFFSIHDGQEIRKVLFTGDILCPLLRKKDYQTIENIDLLVCDANNRFPYPKSNHWSILNGLQNQRSEILSDFIKKSSVESVLYPHLNNQIADNYCRCFDYFLNKELLLTDFIFSISSFVELIKPKKAALIHYSGSEDEKYYEQSILNSAELGLWIEDQFQKSNLKTKFIVPYVSEHIYFL